MIVAIHQPHFMPWLGYLDRMLRADVFILLDHVQFERRNYQNRTKIRLEDEAKWLTVPVVQLSQKERIVEKRVDNPPEAGDRWWGPSSFQTLRYAYRKAPFFDPYAEPLREIFEKRWDRLVDLNQATLDFLREAYDIRTPLLKSSDLQVEGQKSGLLLNLCTAIGGTCFLGGMGGSRHYLDLPAFEQAGVGVMWQDFKHPQYPQCGTAPFIPGLSALDLLFNVGPQARDVLHGAGTRKASHDGERVAA